jgi:hypothetical protein
MTARRIAAVVMWLAVFIASGSALRAEQQSATPPWPIGVWQGEIKGFPKMRSTSRYMRIFF